MIVPESVQKTLYTRRTHCTIAARVLALLIAMTWLPRPVAAQQSPAGFWNTISDTDGRPTAVVEIREVNGEYVGTVRALLVPADPADSICGKCNGERKNQRIVGMEILWNMRKDGAEWSGGQILDPQNGKTYRAKMKLTDDGRKLVVRGYLGLSLFGRSQTWTRRTE